MCGAVQHIRSQVAVIRDTLGDDASFTNFDLGDPG